MLDPNAEGWTVVSEPERLLSLGAHDRYAITLEKNGATREVFVQISYTAAACDSSTLPSPVREFVRTKGVAFLTGRELSRVEPAQLLVVHTLGHYVIPRPGSYLPGDRVDVLRDDSWFPGTFNHAGEPDDGMAVATPAADAGARVADVGFVRLDDPGALVRAPYAEIRPAGDD